MTEMLAPVDHSALAQLRAEFRGALVHPGDAEFDRVRAVWNGMHDRSPHLVARCVGAPDVAAALRYAAAAGRAVTVRGGGHNVAGTAVADEAVMIDLSLMRQVRVDPEALTAEADGGCLLGDVDAATTAHGLACPAGVVSHTGLAGLTLGGGYGWLARTWGLTCDHLVSAEVVLADGSIVEASEESHPELLWGLRGGGGNLGVVTRFTLRLRPVGEVFHRTGVFPLDQAPAALARYREFAEAQDNAMHAVGTLKVAGQQEWVPAELRGTPALFLTAAWFGEAAEGPARTDALFERAAGGRTQLMSYAQLQALGDFGEPHGHRYFTKSCYLTELSEGPVEQLVESARQLPSTLSAIDFEYLRGAISDDPGADAAFPRRDAPYICTVSAQWTDPAEDAACAAWSRTGVERLTPWQFGGAYVNYLQDEAPGKVAEVYGSERYERLAALKDRYDPQNVLAGNQNIAPATRR
ncbi:FAD linked oxidase-like protein [Kitasatospora sp. MMS16-BH015]|uniref:FAD-binding oxidoreductase n=1 Tax=Kitasatospora sp. MMS16-BH015 TaxID=2018025 RepID=UPI000CA28858|nr:FAD-binding oxidoreductase [Kitasatospora sp. MMS16-BH015]AUG77447.1 FAD linked oxidase-like protein [Kitasatospora sp. MMS16-BH015]